MSNLEHLKATARKLARSGKFHGWQPIAFELQFEEGFAEAREWLFKASTRDDLDRLCREARKRTADRAA